jgi:hypothetical protein
MTAYGGTYKFDGKTVEHDIDIAWNEAWVGTKQMRTVTRDGGLTLTTPPFPFHTLTHWPLFLADSFSASGVSRLPVVLLAKVAG